MKFELEDYPKNDSLKIVSKCCIEFFRFHLVKYYCLLCLNTIIFIDIIETRYFLQVFDSHIFLKFAPTFFALQLTVVSILRMFLINGVGQNGLKDLQMWKVKFDNQNFTNQIKEEYRNVSLFMIFTLILAAIGGFIFLFPSEANNDLFYIYVWMDDYLLPEWKYWVSWFICISHIFVGFTCVASSYEFMYTITHEYC